MELSEMLNNSRENLRQFLSDNKTLTAYWALITLLLLYQHSLGWNWDFLVYLMNGEYIFHGGSFMEWLRPPVVPVSLGILQFFFTKNVSGYIFIAIASTFFLYAVNRLVKSWNLDELAMYVLMLTPAAISFSTREGTEMLSLAFVMLFLADINKAKSGIWLGLSIMTRYTYGILLPLVLLQKDIRKSTRTYLVTGIIGLPWVIYSFKVTGDPFTSPISFIALNMILRTTSTPINLFHFAIISAPTILTILALLKASVREKVLEKIKGEKITLAMLYIFLVTCIIYLNSGITHLRYLYPMILPLAFFTSRIWEQTDRKKLLYGFIAFNLVFGSHLATSSGYETPATYQNIENNLDNCMVESDSWPPLNYAGAKATHPVNSETTVKRLKEGWRIVDFTGNVIDTEKERKTAEIIKDTGTYTIYGIKGRCAEPRNVDRNRIDEYNMAHNTSYTPTGFMIEQLIGGTKN